MPLPILMAAALVASSAIMVAPYANEELKKKDIANKVDHLSATEIADRQSTRLSASDVGYTSIVVNDQKESLSNITNQSWFVPALFAGAAFVAFMVLK